MTPSPQNGERDPRDDRGGFSFLPWILLALAAAVIFHVLLTRNARADSVGFIPSGTWLTTESGRRVCMTTFTITRFHQILNPGFCTEWQQGSFPMSRGQQWPVRDSDPWVRYAKPYMSQGNYLQFHTEQGWKP